MDLGCERCARVYLAVLKKRVTWLEQIVRDTGMKRKTVKRHLDRLLALGLVAETVIPWHNIPGYKIAKELDSVKKMTEKGGE